MMPNNRLWLLMSRRLSGEIREDEQAELNALLENFPDKQYLFELLHSYFDARPAGSDVDRLDEADLEERFIRLVGEPDPSAKGAEIYPISTVQRRPMIKKILYAAAIASGLILLGWGGYRVSRRSDRTPVLAASSGSNEVTARPGVRTKLELPDGTRVWLNSGSTLNYQNDFNTRTREVVLIGEAFFDVIKDPAHPFIVHASSIDVKVLGTSFTVKSYPQDETIETTLLRGMVEVTRQDIPGTPRVILKPNEKLVLNRNPVPLPHASPVAAQAKLPASSLAAGISVSAIADNVSDSDKVETSWMYNKLVFNGDAFRELAQKMERWYNVRIVFKDEELMQYRFAGVFDHETIVEALNALQLTARFTYKIKNNEIELYAK